MAIRTPEPRLPLEPEEYPLYQPPRRVGCSGITIVTLLALAAFVFLVWRVTPPMAKAITDFPKTLPFVGPLFQDDDTDTDTGVGAFATQTPEAIIAADTTPLPVAPTLTAGPPPPAPTNTPVPQYVRVANTGGRGVRIRQEPKADAPFEKVAAEGEVLQITGPDTPDPNNANQVWRQVSRVSDGASGYILNTYLVPNPGPNP